MTKINYKVNFSITFFIIFLIFSCKSTKEAAQNTELNDPIVKSKREKNPLSIIENKLDLDLDGTPDFVFEKYLQPNHNEYNVCDSIVSFSPLTNGQLLLKPSYGILHLNKSDTLSYNDNWTKFGVVLLKKCDKDDTTWSPATMAKLKSYYVGVIFNNGDRKSLGWFKFDIDFLTSKIKIVDSEFTDSQTLIIR